MFNCAVKNYFENFVKNNSRIMGVKMTTFAAINQTKHLLLYTSTSNTQMTAIMYQVACVRLFILTILFCNYQLLSTEVF